MTACPALRKQRCLHLPRVPHLLVLQPRGGGGGWVVRRENPARSLLDLMLTVTFCRQAVFPSPTSPESSSRASWGLFIQPDFIECSRHRTAGEIHTPVPGRDAQAGKADLSGWARCSMELRAQALGWAERGGEGASGELDSGAG